MERLGGLALLIKATLHNSVYTAPPELVRECDEPRLQDGVPVVRVARHPEDRQVARDPYREVAPLVARESELALHLRCCCLCLSVYVSLAASSTSRTAAVLLNSLALGSPGESPESGEYQSGSDDDEPLRARAVRNGDGASPLVQRQPSPRTGAPGRRRGQAPSPLAAAVG